jgi:hypothetical protein
MSARKLFTDILSELYSNSNYLNQDYIYDEIGESVERLMSKLEKIKLDNDYPKNLICERFTNCFFFLVVDYPSIRDENQLNSKAFNVIQKDFIELEKYFNNLANNSLNIKKVFGPIGVTGPNPAVAPNGNFLDIYTQTYGTIYKAILNYFAPDLKVYSESSGLALRFFFDAKLTKN